LDLPSLKRTWTRTWTCSHKVDLDLDLDLDLRIVDLDLDLDFTVAGLVTCLIIIRQLIRRRNMSIKSLQGRHLNAHPQCLGPTSKVFFQLICFFGCFIMCILFSPTVDCF